MMKALLLRKVAAAGFSFFMAVAVPYMVHDKPRIQWVWDKLGPVIVDAADIAPEVDGEVEE